MNHIEAAILRNRQNDFAVRLDGFSDEDWRQLGFKLDWIWGDDGLERLVVKGRLMAKPLQCEEDIASEFSYTINSKDRHLCSLREKTFAGRSLHLELDSVEINRPIDHSLFELPRKQKMVMSNMEEYLNIGNRRWTPEAPTNAR
jgi:hypothetical protein